LFFQISGYIYICMYLSKPLVPPWVNTWETTKILPPTPRALPHHGFTQILPMTCTKILALLPNRRVRYHTANIPGISERPVKAALLRHCSGCWPLPPPPSRQPTQARHPIAQNARASSPALAQAGLRRPVSKSKHHQHHRTACEMEAVGNIPARSRAEHRQMSKSSGKLPGVPISTKRNTKNSPSANQ